MNKNLSSKYSQKLFDHAKQYAIDVLKTALKRTIQKRPEETGDLTGNTTADKITIVSRCSPQNSSETVKSETENIIRLDREISKEK